MAFLRHANNSINLDHYDMKRRYSPRAVLSQIVVTIHGPLGKNSIYAPRSRARNLSKKQFFPFTQRPCFRDVPLLANEQNNFTNFTHNKNICLSLQNKFGLESINTWILTSGIIFDRFWQRFTKDAKSQTWSLECEDQLKPLLESSAWHFNNLDPTKMPRDFQGFPGFFEKSSLQSFVSLPMGSYESLRWPEPRWTAFPSHRRPPKWRIVKRVGGNPMDDLMMSVDLC